LRVKTIAEAGLNAFGRLPYQLSCRPLAAFSKKFGKLLKAALRQARPDGGRVHFNSRSMED
jgi:hypothetical protein